MLRVSANEWSIIVIKEVQQAQHVACRRWIFRDSTSRAVPPYALGLQPLRMPPVLLATVHTSNVSPAQDLGLNLFTHPTKALHPSRRMMRRKVCACELKSAIEAGAAEKEESARGLHAAFAFPMRPVKLCVKRRVLFATHRTSLRERERERERERKRERERTRET